MRDAFSADHGVIAVNNSGGYGGSAPSIAHLERQTDALETIADWLDEIRAKLRRGELLRDLGLLDEADQDELEAKAAALMQVMVAFIAGRRAA